MTISQTNALAGLDVDAGMQTAIADANALAEAALLIQSAETDDALAAALRQTFQLWTGLKTDMAWHRNWPAELIGSFQELADYVLATILSAERGEMTLGKLETLATVNLQIATGILEAQIRGLLGDQAFARWVADGRPLGADMEAWMQADQPVALAG